MSKLNKTSILILSDIHYSNDANMCRLCSNTNSEHYLSKFLTFLETQEKKEDIKIKYLIIAGDLAENGKRSEYQEVNRILNKIIDTLAISRNHVLIIPGNHDVSRDKLASYCDENNIPENQASQCSDIKFSNFISFYKEFKKIDTYDINKVIVDKLYVSECNLTILGLNTNSKESHRKQDHKGYIEIEKFRNEVATLNSNSEYIILSHHSWASDREKELPTIENAQDAKEILSLKGINTYIYGHHHATDRKNIRDHMSNCQYCEIGSFSKILTVNPGDDYCNTFTLAIIDDKKHNLLLKKYTWFQDSWNYTNTQSEIAEIELVKNSKQISKIHNEISTEFMESSEEVSSHRETSDLVPSVLISSNSQKYIDIIAESKLYKEGHYHWENGENTLGWINISDFLGKNNVISNIRMEFKWFYENEIKYLDALIGYGMEGNIIGSGLTPFCIKEKIRYFYYPSIHKKFTEEEKIIWNQSVALRNVAFIFDFMPSDRYIKDILLSNKEFLKFEKIHIFSVFYTDENDTLLASINIEPSNQSSPQKTKSFEVHRYSVCKFLINKCLRDKSRCQYYVNKMANVIEL